MSILSKFFVSKLSVETAKRSDSDFGAKSILGRTKKQNSIWIAIFFTACFLRVAIAFFNRESNDDHFGVIMRLLNHDSVVRVTDCWQCYQPKFYYYFCADLIKIFNISAINDQIVFAQFVNVAAGAITILFFWLLIRELTISDRLKYLLFAFVSLNPKLVGINAQVSNDTFVILFSTISIYFLYFYLAKEEKKYLIFSLLGAVLAAISKGSGIFIFVAVFIVILVRLFANPKEIRGKLFSIVLLFLISLAITFFCGPYYSNVKNYGTPIKANWASQAPPKFFEKSYVGRPGVTSVVDSFFTFRIIELYKNPYISGGETSYSIARTSLWTQVYGRANSWHFDQWPVSWRDTKPFVLNIVRVLITLGLLPALLLLIGFLKSMLDIILGFKKYLFKYFEYDKNWIFSVFFILIIVMLIKINLDGREFTAMKAIYIYPAILPMIYFIAKGYELFKNKLNLSSNIFENICLCSLLLYCIFAICDSLILIVDLVNSLV